MTAVATPILFIVFNRPDTTRVVFDAIRSAKPLKLYIAADAAREDHHTDEERTRAVKEIVSKVDWPCEVQHLYADKNLGCGIAVSNAINWFFRHEEEGIILEDDCVPHPDFFPFIAQMLERFRNDHRVISISGSNLGYHGAEAGSYLFSRFMNMWGWATWRSRAATIDYSLAKWKNNKHPFWWLHYHLRQHLFDLDLGWYRLWKIKFDKVTEDKKFTWDWQWNYQQLNEGQLSVVPSVNLVSNIGFNEDGTHTKASDNPAANIPTHSLAFPLVHPSEIAPDHLYEEKYVKWVWCYHKRMNPVKFTWLRIKNMLR